MRFHSILLVCTHARRAAGRARPPRPRFPSTCFSTSSQGMLFRLQEVVSKARKGASEWQRASRLPQSLRPWSDSKRDCQYWRSNASVPIFPDGRRRRIIKSRDGLLPVDLPLFFFLQLARICHTAYKENQKNRLRCFLRLRVC